MTAHPLRRVACALLLLAASACSKNPSDAAANNSPAAKSSVPVSSTSTSAPPSGAPPAAAATTTNLATPRPPAVGRPTVSIGHTQQIAAATLSPDGRKLFTMDEANLRVWDVESGKEIKLLKSYEGGNSGRDARWSFTFAEDRKWLLLTRGGGVSVFNYDTLEELPGWERTTAQAVQWDRRRGKGYYLTTRGSTSANTYEVGELTIRDGKWTSVARARVGVPLPPKTWAYGRRLLFLDEDRLLVDTTAGHFIIDLKSWLASRADAEPTRETISPDFTYALFPPLSDRREYSPGPPGLIFARTTLDGKMTRDSLEVLSAKDLSVQRSATLEGSYFYPPEPRDYDAPTKTLWLRSFKYLLAVDFDTLAVRQKIDLEELLKDGSLLGAYLTNADRLPDGQWLLTGYHLTWKYDPAAKRPTLTFGDRVAGINRLITGPKGFEFLVSDNRDRAKRVRFLPGGLEVTTVSGRADGLAYEPTGEAIARGASHTGIVDISDYSWPKKDFSVPLSGTLQNASAANLAYSSDGSVIAMHSWAGVAAISMLNGNTLLDEKLSGKAIHRDPHLVAVSPDNRWVVAFDGDKKIVGFDLHAAPGKRRAWEQKIPYLASLFSFISPQIFLCFHNGHLEYRAVESGVLLTSIPLERQYSHSRSAAISADRRFVAICSSELRIYDAETGRLLWEHDTATNVTSVAFFPNSRYVVTVNADNLVRLWDREEKRELCTLALFAHNDDWVVSTPELRFDASEKAIDKMYVVKGTDIIPLESLFEHLYTPKLVTTLLAGEKLPPVTVDLVNLRTPPTVRLTLANGTRNLVVEDDTRGQEASTETLELRAAAEARDSSIAEIRLFQNGKLLSTASGAGASQTQTFSARLVPGENVFRAVALNAERTESRPSELIVNYRAPASAGPTVPSTPVAGGAGLQLHLLVVGVNAYKNPKYNLNYAVADATAFKQRVEAQTKSIFTAVNVRFIVNDEVRKESIVDAFKAMATKAGPRDVFVFYFAGHGVMTADAKPEFFLVPHDVTQLYGADDALRQRGLASAELFELSKQMPAQKQLFILDACQSAGALKSVAQRGAAEEKAIAQLARSTGTHWLTASGSEQFASEFDKLGHGAFTYALLEGLAGKADSGDKGDGRVTVNELKAWLETQVPEITQKHKGTPQYPSSYGFGQDFPLVVSAK